MDSVVGSLAALAFLGVVLLLFANSALLKLVRDLQEGLADLRLAVGRGDEPRPAVPAFASGTGQPTFALLVDAQCPACAERAERLVVLAARNPSARLVAVSADPGCAAWFDDGVTVHIDAGLVGRIGVNVTPTLLKYGPDGEEEWRRVVGSDADLDRLLGLTGPSAAGSSSTGPSSTGPSSTGPSFTGSSFTDRPATAGADARGGTK
jgi:hypothetical protein